MAGALDEVKDVLFSYEEAEPYVEELREALRASVRSACSSSGGDAVHPDMEDDSGDTVIINGVMYKKIA